MYISTPKRPAFQASFWGTKRNPKTCLRNQWTQFSCLVVPLVVDTEKIYGLLNGLVRVLKWGLKQVLNDKGMSQTQIGMRLLYVQKANFDKEKVLGVWVTGPSGDLSVERSPLGAGGRPKAELHRPPPLPWAGCGRDQRHRARTGPCTLMFHCLICWFIFSWFAYTHLCTTLVLVS